MTFDKLKELAKAHKELRANNASAYDVTVAAVELQKALREFQFTSPAQALELSAML